MNPTCKFYFCLLFIGYLFGFGTCKEAFARNADSLLTVATNINASSSDRIGAYGALVYHFEISDPEKALDLGRQGLALQPNDSAYDVLGVLNVNIGFVYKSRNDIPSEIQYFEAAAEAFIKAGKPIKAGLQYKNIGISYRKLGDYALAINYQLKGLKIFEQHNAIPKQVSAIINIGNIYIFQKQPELAFPYYEKALKLARLQSDTLLLTKAINSYALGFDHLSQNDSAQHYYLIAIEQYKNLGRWVKKAKAEHNVALLYFDDASYEKAQEMLVASLNVFEQLPANFDVEKATVKMNLARVYMVTNREAEARIILEEVLETFRKYGVKTEIKSTMNYLALTYAELGEYQLAYSTQKAFIILKDSIQNVEIITKIAELNEKYESEKKENKILILENDNIAAQKTNLLVLIFSIGIIAFIIIVFLVYRQMKIKELTVVKLKLKQNDRELDILREKIELGTTQYLTSNQFTINREEVNAFLKEDLSARELDVFMLLIQGLTNKEIGEELFISVSTIKFHLQKIYVKLDVNNRKDAVQIINPRTGKAA